MKIHDLVKIEGEVFEIRAITSGDFPYLVRNLSNNFAKEGYKKGFGIDDNLKTKTFGSWYAKSKNVEYLGSKENYPELFI